jgi:uncharacterized PurR-regulated membrane protein YhhQ (DUF165 family)
MSAIGMCAATAVSGLSATAIVAMRCVCLSAKHGHTASRSGPARIAVRDWYEIIVTTLCVEGLVIFLGFVGTLAILRTAFP